MSNPSKQPKIPFQNQSSCVPPQARKTAKPKTAVRFPPLSLIKHTRRSKDIFLPTKQAPAQCSNPTLLDNRTGDQGQGKQAKDDKRNLSQALCVPRPCRYFPVLRSNPVFPLQLSMRGDQFHPSVPPALLLMWTHQRVPYKAASLPLTLTHRPAMGQNHLSRLSLPALDCKPPFRLPAIEAAKETDRESQFQTALQLPVIQTAKKQDPKPRMETVWTPLPEVLPQHPPLESLQSAPLEKRSAVSTDTDQNCLFLTDQNLLRETDLNFQSETEENLVLERDQNPLSKKDPNRQNLECTKPSTLDEKGGGVLPPIQPLATRNATKDQVARGFPHLQPLSKQEQQLVAMPTVNGNERMQMPRSRLTSRKPEVQDKEEIQNSHSCPALSSQQARQKATRATLRATAGPQPLGLSGVQKKEKLRFPHFAATLKHMECPMNEDPWVPRAVQMTTLPAIKKHKEQGPLSEPSLPLQSRQDGQFLPVIAKLAKFQEKQQRRVPRFVPLLQPPAEEAEEKDSEEEEEEEENFKEGTVEKEEGREVNRLPKL